jgi:hypothetical protein
MKIPATLCLLAVMLAGCVRWPGIDTKPMKVRPVPASAEFISAPTAPVPVNLQWAGPAGWQTNGYFLIRQTQQMPPTLPEAQWPVLMNVVGAGATNVTLNADPNYWLRVSFTNTNTGTETAEGVGPIHMVIQP